MSGYEKKGRFPLVLIRKIFRGSVGFIFGVRNLRICRVLIRKMIRNNVVIREAELEDYEQLSDLYLVRVFDMKTDILNVKKEGFWLVAQRKGTIVGALTIAQHSEDAGLWFISGLEVKFVLRGLGIWELLVKAAIDKAKESNAKEIMLFVNEKATPALNLYKKLGFEPKINLPRGIKCNIGEVSLSYKFNE